MAFSPLIYPVLEKFTEEQPDDEEDQQHVGPTTSPQQTSLINSFDVNSIAASSTPIMETSAHQRKSRTSPNLNDTTYMAGNLDRRAENYRFSKNEWVEEHSSTNTTSCTDYSASQCFSRLIDDFRVCSSSGGWLQFITKHHLTILATICLVILAATFVKGLHGVSKANEPTNMWTAYKTELKPLMKEFGVRKSDIHSMLVLGQQWIVDKKEEPVVLTIAGQNSATLAEKLLKIFDKISHHKAVSGVISGNENLKRSELHDLVKQELEGGVLAVAAVSDVDRLEWDAPLVLHAFADSDSFPVKNSLLILSLENLSSEGASDCEEGIYDHLLERWIASGGSMDNVTPILSRIMSFSLCL